MVYTTYEFARGFGSQVCMHYFSSFLFPDGLQTSGVCEVWKANFDVVRFLDATLYCYKDLNAFDGVVCIQIMTGAVGLWGARGGMGGLGGGRGNNWVYVIIRFRCRKRVVFSVYLAFLISYSYTSWFEISRLVPTVFVTRLSMFPPGSWRALSVFVFYCFCPRSFFPRSFVCLNICYCHRCIVF